MTRTEPWLRRRHENGLCRLGALPPKRMTASWSGYWVSNRIQGCGATPRAQGGLPSVRNRSASICGENDQPKGKRRQTARRERKTNAVEQTIIRCISDDGPPSGPAIIRSRTILISGSKATIKRDRIKAAGVLAKRRCKPSLTQSRLRVDRCLKTISSKSTTSEKALSVRSNTS